MRASGAAGTRVTNRRSFLNGMTLAGAAALTPSSTRAAASNVRLAQASQGAGAAAPAAPLTVKSVGRLAGSSAGYAYAIKAGPWVFLTGHQAFDFQPGPAPARDGPPRPPPRRRP